MFSNINVLIYKTFLFHLFDVCHRLGFKDVLWLIVAKVIRWSHNSDFSVIISTKYQTKTYKDEKVSNYLNIIIMLTANFLIGS